jgi:hypothetical protein
LTEHGKGIVNYLGPVGLATSAVTALLSPLAFFAPCPFAVVIPVVLLGTVVSITSLFTRTRLFGVLALVISGSCMGVWGAYAARLATLLRQPLEQYDLALGDYLELCWDCQEIDGAVARYRARKGSLPSSLAVLLLDAGFSTDPWNNPYVYVIDDGAPSGYEIYTAGRDGVLHTDDDIEVRELEHNAPYKIGAYSESSR